MMDTLTIAALSTPVDVDIQLQINSFRVGEVAIHNCSQTYTAGRSNSSFCVCSEFSVWDDGDVILSGIVNADTLDRATQYLQQRNVTNLYALSNWRVWNLYTVRNNRSANNRCIRIFIVPFFNSLFVHKCTSNMTAWFYAHLMLLLLL